MRKGKPKTGKIVNCVNCHNPLYVPLNRLKKSQNISCGKKCMGEFNSKNCKTKMITVCPICKKEIKNKPSLFKKIKGTATCSRSCRAVFLKTNYLGIKNPNQKYNNLQEQYFARRVQNIRSRAKIRKISCSLKENDLLEKYKEQNGLCYYTGIPLKFTSEENTANQPDFDIISVDRVNNHIGYEKENIVLCCNVINKMKGSGTIEELQGIFNYIISKYNEPCQIAYKKLNEKATEPLRAKFGDIGYDITATSIEDLGDSLKVHTGIAIQPQIGWYIEVFPRSSINKKRLVLANSVGIIDNGYRGEIICIFYKLDNWTPIEIGERIAQLIPRRYAIVELKEVKELEDSERGALGFGSTGN